MRALNIKLWRNLWGLRAQSTAIALVIALGVATFVMSLASLDSLRLTQQQVYQSQYFSDLFVDLKRAPEAVAERLRLLPGVATVETRVRAPVNLQLEGYDEPIVGQIISIGDGRQPELNRLFLRAGSLPESGHSDQVLISDAFAEAHALKPGDRLAVVVNGRYQVLRISGIALSPEFIYHIRPGELFPDFERYAILWMNRPALAAAFGMEGAFNNVVFTLAPGSGADPVIAAIDLVLEPYGGLGAYHRDEQISHRYIDEELTQLEGMAEVVPLIFLGVAAFLLNVVTARLIRTQREQIAVLKAFGYTSLQVAGHYLAMILLVVLIGSVLGILLGLWLAEGMASLYQTFFRFPYLSFELRPVVALGAILIAGGAAILGCLGALRSAFRLHPAEAMRPEPPGQYRRTVIERLGIDWLSQPVRMILRNLERHPYKALLSMLGIAFAVAIVLMSGFQKGAIDHMIDVQFRLAQKQDMTISFNELVSTRASHELQALPGVNHVEGFRVAPVILRNGQHSYRTSLQGYLPESRLFLVLNAQLESMRLPDEGLMLTDHLARILKVSPGDTLQVQFQDGRRKQLEIPVAALVTEYVGVGAYMQRDALSRLLGEGPAINGAFLVVEQDAIAALQQRLEQIPAVAGVTQRESAIRSFNELMDETILVFNLFTMFMAAAIAFAVIYNNARIALAERSRELATLRVLGFTRAETGFILLGELLLLTLLALPLGFAIGIGLIWLLIQSLQMDLYRIPLVITPDAFAMAAAVVLLATLISAWLISRHAAQIDMVSALKAAE